VSEEADAGASLVGGERSLLRRGPLLALLVAETVSTTGSMMTWLALPWFVLTTTGSAKQMSFVVGAETLAYALFGVPAGSLLARLGARRAMLLCDALRAPLMLFVPLLHWAGLLSYGLLVAAAFVLGALSTPYGAAQRVIVPELLGEDEGAVSKANALLQSATRSTMLLGPSVAGVLIAAVGAPSVLVIDAATFLAAFCLLATLVPRTPPAAAAADGEGLLAGVRYLRRDPLLSLWTLAILVGDAAWQVVFVGVPVLVFAHYGGRPQLAGFIFAAFGAGAVLGNVVSYRLFGASVDRRLLAGSVLVQALPLWLLTLPVPSWVPVAALALSGLGNGVANPTIHALLTLRPPVSVRAKVLTTVFTASVLGAPLALLAAGPAFAAFGSRTVLGGAAAAQLAAMLALAGSALAWQRDANAP
jgi:MFS family permease